jgi:hypothetical protein
MGVTYDYFYYSYYGFQQNNFLLAIYHQINGKIIKRNQKHTLSQTKLTNLLVNQLFGYQALEILG